jgi:hypothetical protein
VTGSGARTRRRKAFVSALEDSAVFLTREGTMEDRNAAQAQKFSEMSAFGKIKHIGKVVVFLLSFGFIYPNIFSD